MLLMSDEADASSTRMNVVVHGLCKDFFFTSTYYGLLVLQSFSEATKLEKVKSMYTHSILQI